MQNQKRLIPSTSMLMAFDASVRNRSFTAAAQELNLSQGAISRQVGALENLLDVRLFIRIRKSIQLTDAGKLYSKEIAKALQSIRNASLQVMSNPKGGTLNLAILPTFGMRWLMPRFPDFLHKNPQVTVNFVSKLSPFDFNTEDLHAAIHFGREDWPHANSTFLMKEELIPVASPSLVNNKPSTNPENLAAYPLLHLETRPNAWKKWFEQNNVDAKVRKDMVFEQFSLLTQAAVASLGAALLPRFLIQTELDHGELIELLNVPLKSDSAYHIVIPSHYSTYAPANAFKKWLIGIQ